MNNRDVCGSYNDPLWRQYGADRTRPEQYVAGRSEELRGPNQWMHDKEVIAKYINGPTPLEVTFDEELKMAVRRFRLKVDAHMAAEWEKARLRRAEAASTRWNRKINRSRESGVTFSQECAEMLAKVKKKIEIQMAVEKVKLNELMAKEGECKLKDGAKLNREMVAKMVDKKFEVPLADVYCFRSVLKELKAKAGGKISEENRGDNEAIGSIDKQEQKNDEAVNTEISETDAVLDHDAENIDDNESIGSIDKQEQKNDETVHTEIHVQDAVLDHGAENIDDNESIGSIDKQEQKNDETVNTEIRENVLDNDAENNMDMKGSLICKLITKLDTKKLNVFSRSMIISLQMSMVRRKVCQRMSG